MHFSLETKTVTLSVGDFAGFSLGPQDSGGGPQGIWRAQLGQHWHNELQKRTEQEFTVAGALRPDVKFEVPIQGRLLHRGWTYELQGRIDQQIGDTLREIKSVMRPLPAEETALRADYPAYFLQLAAYVVLRRTQGAKTTRAELIFVEAGSGLAQTITLTPFDEALVFHQLDILGDFLNQQLRATARRRSLQFRSPFASLRPGQETIQSDLSSALRPFAWVSRSENQGQTPGRQQAATAPSSVVLFEAPTGYGKTGCVLEYALGQLKAGRFARLIWLTGKSTGQIQVMHTLRQMTAPDLSLPPSPLSPAATPLAVWQVRNKAEHCVNHTFHCVRDSCDYLRDCAERWPGSGLARFHLDDREARDLDTLKAAGRAATICPYEITRAALPFNDVWIGDFNYVFAPDNRGLFFDQPGFDPAETLLVIDEAHNLPSRVAGAYSHRATESEAHLLLAELDHLSAPAPLVLAVEAWIRLLASLQPAESLDPITEAEIRDLVESIVKLTTTHPLDYAALGPVHSETLWSFAALANFMADPTLKKLIWVARPGQLEFTCVDAAAAIGATLKPFGGAILMSATLFPYAEFAESCGLNGVEVEPALRAGSARAEPAHLPYTTLVAPTPWRAGAYDVAVDLRVSTTYRDRASHHPTTAATIAALHEAATGKIASGEGWPQAGVCRCVAVFFPSYAYAESIQKTLADYGSVLRVALQPKLPDLAAQTAWVEENLALSDVLFLVLGSSFAEGIDLLGGRVTHAMVVGPALPEVNAVQKARMDVLHDLGRDAAFRRVYQIPGLQKVNQGLGRLVRAPGQKAKVLLHCRRFAEPSYAALLAADYQLYREIGDESDLRAWLAGHCDE
ncbi:ATP-dependent DNA helicase DinG [Lacunisphaera limnophila]|uniref:ATP-dependent DNA helicase DinG n=1 Tax=Lacunisphaera limnophila TaxID=1838286 RepID=A0A1D8AWS9_9BACT|nr:helicase C-terminal domain-containing protein [Lacunisphaera limnophila]AOS45344.1 ATP-dependent DNA helicase DinG [Lacunisphaera limnophila]